MAAVRDVVIIGAGHNGLVTAFYLARKGLRPLLLERREVVGGAAITSEIHPGFRCPTLSHAAGPLLSSVVSDMRLLHHGLRMVRPEAQLFVPGPDGRALVLWRDAARSTESIIAFSKEDSRRYPDYLAALGRIGTALSGLLEQTPPDLDSPSAADLWRMLRSGSRLRRLEKKDFYRTLRWAPMAVADVAAEWFETERLRAAVAARGVFGTFQGPWSAGTGALLLMRAAAGDTATAGGTEFPAGGMGALTQAMAAAALEAGAEIRVGARVAQIEVKDGATTGVVLESGEVIPAKVVVSNADPRRTFLDLLDPAHLDPSVIARARNYRSDGATLKVNLALDRLPTFAALPRSGSGAADGNAALSGRIHIGPEVDHLERAFDDAKYGGMSRKPWMEVTIPSLADPTLAPPGKQVMSIYAQYFPRRLKTGDWKTRREEAGDLIVRSLAEHAPDLPGLVLARQVITPLDLEETYALTGGHIFHGEMSLDQLFATRPFLGCARYRAPIKGLYLCGAGTHPGGGVTGSPGRNAAREILKDLRSR